MATSLNGEIIERAGRHLLQNYRQQPIVLAGPRGPPRRRPGCPRRSSEHFLARGRALAARRPDQVKAVRGRGLLLGIELTSDSASQVARCRAQGLLVNMAGEATVRFAPPFVVSLEELDEGLELFEQALPARPQ